MELTLFDKRVILAMAITISIVAFACSGGVDGGNPASSAPPDDDLLSVVTTVSPITSIVENIGGTKIKLTGIVPEGTNSHTFEPAPSVAVVLSKADLIIANGLFLEEPSIALAEANMKPGATILRLADSTVSREEWAFDFSFPQSGGKPNPHLWTDPIMGLRYAELVRDELVRLDGENAAYYNENYEKFKAKIEDLDRRIVAAVESIPPGNRKLLTYHDSFPYFSKRYGMEIIGAVQPSDFKEPSAREVAELIDQVKAEKVPAIFGSEVFPSPIMEQIAKEGGARFIDQLRDDDLPGAPGDPRHTYLGLILADMEIMVPALGGDTEAFIGFDPSLVFSDGESRAEYPQ